jgi:hypothetical protein
MKKLIIFDGRNIFGLDEVKKANVYYESMGRKLVSQV